MLYVNVMSEPATLLAVTVNIIKPFTSSIVTSFIETSGVTVTTGIGGLTVGGVVGTGGGVGAFGSLGILSKPLSTSRSNLSSTIKS